MAYSQSFGDTRIINVIAVLIDGVAITPYVKSSGAGRSAIGDSSSYSDVRWVHQCRHFG
jgi:hypothetical protein